MHKIVVPFINSNETFAVLVNWEVENGARVQEGDLIATLETSKASFDLQSEHAGVIRHLGRAGNPYDYNSTIAHILESDAELKSHSQSNDLGENKAQSVDDLIITKAAQSLIDEKNVAIQDLQKLGKKVIKTKDVQDILIKEEQNGGVELSVMQKSIARVVSASHAKIPASYLVKKVYVDQAHSALSEYSSNEGTMCGFTDLILYLCSRQTGEHPIFFGELDDDLSFRPSTEGNIGVTFDMGKGLFIPVVHGAAAMSLREIAKIMMKFRRKAARSNFVDADLSGGDFSISINMDQDILLVHPIILPPQTAMLALGAVHKELFLDCSDGVPKERSYVLFGLTFDHRVINGYEANAFLNALKKAVEKLKL